MDAPPEIWQSMNICEALLNELTSLKIYDSGYMSRHEAIYLNQLVSVFSFLPEIQTLSICNVPLYAFTASLATFHGLTKFEVQLYRQAAEVLDVLPCMTSISSLGITCDANVAEFHCIIKLPSVTSLTLQDSKSMEGLPIVWSMLQLENLCNL